MKKLKPEDPLDSNMRVLKSSTCSTLSGKSTLTYHIGCTPDAEVHFRVHENTGAGFFSREWVALKDIHRVLKKCPEGKPIFSYVLHPLFKGKSVNNHAFLLAVLIQEKLLSPLKSNRRVHEILDPAEFITKVGKLMSSKTVGNAEVKTGGMIKEKTGGKTVVKTAGVNEGKPAGKATGKTGGDAGGKTDGKKQSSTSKSKKATTLPVS